MMIRCFGASFTYAVIFLPLFVYLKKQYVQGHNIFFRVKFSLFSLAHKKQI